MHTCNDSFSESQFQPILKRHPDVTCMPLLHGVCVKFGSNHQTAAVIYVQWKYYEYFHFQQSMQQIGMGSTTPRATRHNRMAC